MDLQDKTVCDSFFGSCHARRGRYAPDACRILSGIITGGDDSAANNCVYDEPKELEAGNLHEGDEAVYRFVIYGSQKPEIFARMLFGMKCSDTGKIKV